MQSDHMLKANNFLSAITRSFGLLFFACFAMVVADVVVMLALLSELGERCSDEHEDLSDFVYFAPRENILPVNFTGFNT